MKRNPHSPAAWPTARRAPEVYCRRDNRVYDVCPYAAGGIACPCVQGMETADALFEIPGTDARHAEDRGPE